MILSKTAKHRSTNLHPWIRCTGQYCKFLVVIIAIKKFLENEHCIVLTLLLLLSILEVSIIYFRPIYYACYFILYSGNFILNVF